MNNSTNANFNQHQLSALSEFPAIAKTPTILTNGIRYDFNYGARVFVSKEVSNIKIIITDLDTHTQHVNETIEEHDEDLIVQTKIKYYVRWEILVFSTIDHKILLREKLDFAESWKRVCVQLPIGALGDTIAWFKWIPFFQRKHEKEIDCVINPSCWPLFKKTPSINFITKDEASANCSQYYATYRIGMFYGKDKQTDDLYNQPIDYRICGLSNIAANILGIDPNIIHNFQDAPPIAQLKHYYRKPEKPYVVIATKTTCYAKHWLNPHGWIKVVDYLKDLGFDVYCIDRDDIVCGHEKDNPARFANFTTPYNVIPSHGSLPLDQRFKQIYNASMFIGLSSGLSWLAWMTPTPVIMISNFTADNNEFYTPYRIMNYGVCNSCWNDGREKFINSDFFYCPRHRNDTRAHECHRMISVQQVTDMIDRVIDDYHLLKQK